MDMISLDLGVVGAYSLWKDNRVVLSVKWSFDDKKMIHENLKDIIEHIRQIVHNTEMVIAVERPSIDLGYQWIEFCDIRRVAEQEKCRFVEYTPPLIKKTVTGNGRANKKEIMEVVHNFLQHTKFQGELPGSDHICDSIACGICHLRIQGEL